MGHGELSISRVTHVVAFLYDPDPRQRSNVAYLIAACDDEHEYSVGVTLRRQGLEITSLRINGNDAYGRNTPVTWLPDFHCAIEAATHAAAMDDGMICKAMGGELRPEAGRIRLDVNAAAGKPLTASRQIQ